MQKTSDTIQAIRSVKISATTEGAVRLKDMGEKKKGRSKSSENQCTIKKERAGKRFFFLYAAVYACFILLNVLRPDFMGSPAGDFNIALVFGPGLILFAVLLAFIYNNICTRAEERTDESGEGSDKNDPDEKKGYQE